MSNPSFRQGETVGFYGNTGTGKIVKVIRIKNHKGCEYQYKVQFSRRDGSNGFTTVKGDRLYSL